MGSAQSQLTAQFAMLQQSLGEIFANFRKELSEGVLNEQEAVEQMVGRMHSALDQWKENYVKLTTEASNALEASTSTTPNNSSNPTCDCRPLLSHGQRDKRVSLLH